MPPMTTGNIPNSLQPGIRKLIGTRLEGRQTFYSQMYNVETSARNFEDYLYGTGLPIAGEKPQGTNIQSVDVIEGTTKRMQHTVFAMGFEVTEEAWDDDLYTGQGSVIREGANGLADSFAERVEIEAHRPFNAEGFDNATYLVLPDNSNIFATSHAPIPGGQGIAQGNRPVSPTDFNITSYRAMLTQFKRYRDDQNKRIPGYTMIKDLWVPPELEYAAEEIVKNANRPDTMNDVKNVTQNATTVKVNPYLDDTDSWFGLAPKHHFYFLWRWRPRLDSFDDRRARVAVHVIYGRFSNAPIHWLGSYGSNG